MSDMLTVSTTHETAGTTQETAGTTQQISQKDILAGLDKFQRGLNVIKGVAKLLGWAGLQEIDKCLKETRGTLGDDSADYLECGASIAELVITVTQHLVPEAKREEYWNLIKERLMSIEQAVESFMREVVNRIGDTAIPWLSSVTVQLCNFARSVIERSLGEANRLILGTRSCLIKDKLCIEAKSGAADAPPIKPEPTKVNTVKPPIKPNPPHQAQKLDMSDANANMQKSKIAKARRVGGMASRAMIQKRLRQLQHLD